MQTRGLKANNSHLYRSSYDIHDIYENPHEYSYERALALLPRTCFYAVLGRRIIEIDSEEYHFLRLIRDEGEIRFESLEEDSAGLRTSIRMASSSLSRKLRKSSKEGSRLIRFLRHGGFVINIDQSGDPDWSRTELTYPGVFAHKERLDLVTNL